jgi:hypothetical protein
MATLSWILFDLYIAARSLKVERLSKAEIIIWFLLALIVGGVSYWSDKQDKAALNAGFQSVLQAQHDSFVEETKLIGAISQASPDTLNMKALELSLSILKFLDQFSLNHAPQLIQYASQGSRGTANEAQLATELNAQYSKRFAKQAASIRQQFLQRGQSDWAYAAHPQLYDNPALIPSLSESVSRGFPSFQRTRAQIKDFAMELAAHASAQNKVN